MHFFRKGPAILPHLSASGASRRVPTSLSCMAGYGKLTDPFRIPQEREPKCVSQTPSRLTIRRDIFSGISPKDTCCIGFDAMIHDNSSKYRLFFEFLYPYQIFCLTSVVVVVLQSGGILNFCAFHWLSSG